MDCHFVQYTCITFVIRKKLKILKRRSKFKRENQVKGDSKRKKVDLTHPQGSEQDIQLEIRRSEFCSHSGL